MQFVYIAPKVFKVDETYVPVNNRLKNISYMNTNNDKPGSDNAQVMAINLNTNEAEFAAEQNHNSMFQAQDMQNQAAWRAMNL